MAVDRQVVQVLADGRIKIETMGKISAANHVSAEQLLRAIEELTGADVVIERKAAAFGQQAITRKTTQGQ